MGDAIWEGLVKGSNPLRNAVFRYLEIRELPSLTVQLEE